jgi:molybdopterin-guanine dinucleotide biosynthesis protein A
LTCPVLAKEKVMKQSKTLASRLRFFKIKKVRAYVLAGGQSRRIGSDKLLFEFNNTTLLKNTLQICSTLFSTVKIVAKDSNKFKSLSTPVLIDSTLADGPMAGVISALEDCSDDYCFITGADFYDFNEDVIKKVVKSYQNEQYLGLKINGRLQPLCGIYHYSCLVEFKKIAQTKNYKMADSLEQLNSRYIEILLPKWRNINHPEDLEAIRRDHV